MEGDTKAKVNAVRNGPHAEGGPGSAQASFGTRAPASSVLQFAVRPTRRAGSVRQVCVSGFRVGRRLLFGRCGRVVQGELY